MKKILTILILFMFFAFPALAKINVVTTIPDLADIARHVGGEQVSVASLIKGNQDPHYIEPKPSFSAVMNKADLFVSVGLSLEVGWVPVLLTQSRNPKIQRGQPGFLEPWQGIHVLDIPQGIIDRSGGDIHPEGNPHYWLSPENGIIIARNIAKRLGELDPVHQQYYQEQLKNFETQLRSKNTQWKSALSHVRGKQIITHHKSFTYFAAWSGLIVIDRVEDKPGLPPTPSHMVALINLIKQKKIPLVITENYYDPKPSQKLIKETGINVLFLPTSVGGASGVEGYIKLIDTLVSKIAGAL